MSQVSYGTITITDTTDIERIYTVYAKSNNNTTVPTMEVSTWGETISTAPGTGNYIWQRTVVEKSGTGDKTYSDPVCLTGKEGIDATEISGIEVRYGISTDWNTQPTNWNVDTPVYDSSKPKYWTRTRLVYDTNPATYSDPVYTKDEALTKAVADAAIANSIAQHANEDAQGAMAQAGSNINSVIRLWYLTDTASPPDKPSAHVTQTSTSVTGQWTRNKPTVTNYRYYYYCDEICTGGGVYSWTDVVADTLSLTSYELGLINAKIKNHWWDSAGLHFASGINNAEVSTANANTYGYIGTLGLNGLTLGYNSYKAMELLTNALNFYQPPTIGSTTSQGNKTMSLTGNALRFYNPSDGTTEQAVLDANGLKLLKGGIEAGTKNTTNYIYIYSDDDATNHKLTINDHEASDWRIVAGKNFGVDKAGNLYASGANITGKVTITSGSNVYMKTEIDQTYATKIEASQTAQPNLSPFLQNTPYTTDAGYWRLVTNRYTPLADGWAHLSCDNTSGTDFMHNYLRMASCPSVIDGGTYTVLVEIRNLDNTATSGSLYTQQSTVAQIWGATEGFSIVNSSMENGSYYKSVTALGVSQHDTDGTNLMNITWGVPAGAKVDADIRISMYEGEYSGPYKPYSGDQLYASKSELKVANDAISLKVSQDDVINSINVSTEGITIDADKVNIAGAALFTSGRLSENSLNNAYDTNGAAAAVAATIPTDVSDLNNDSGFITSADVPTKVSDLTNDSGFQTATQVSTAVSNGVSGKADKTDAIARTQRIYYRKTSSGAPSKSTTWLTTSGTGYGNWSLKIPQMTSGTTKYPYLYTAVQTQTVSQQAAGSTCTCSDVLLDDTTTVIDGGNIITGTVSANAVDASSGTFDTANIPNLNASKITAGDISADRMKANSITAINSLTTGTINAARLDVGSITVGSLSDGSNYSTTTQMNTAISTAVNDVQIGGRNLLLNTAQERVSPASADGSAYVSPALKATEYGFSIMDNTETYFTYSFDYEVTGNTADTAYVYVQMKNSYAVGSILHVKDAPSGHYSKTFRLTDAQVASTSYNCTIRLRNATDGAVLRAWNIKLECGNKATDWTPAPEDSDGQINWYATCSTEPATADKEATLTTGSLEALSAGTTVSVKFTTANTTDAPTLNVGGTGAKAIWNNNAVAASGNPVMWGANATLQFMYDGTVWVLMNKAPSYAVACSTAATTRDKSASVAGALVVNGTTVNLHFSTANTYVSNSVRFNLSSTGAKNIYVNRTATSTTNTLLWDANTEITLTRTGAGWYMSGRGDASMTATSYITDIDSDNGITIKAVNGTTGTSASTDNYIKLNANGLNVYKGGTSVAEYGDSARVGKESGSHIALDTNGMSIMKNTDKMATFGLTSVNTVGKTVQVNSSELGLGSSVTVAELGDAVSGSEIIAYTYRRSLDVQNYWSPRVATFTKGTASYYYGLHYDGNTIFTNDNSDYVTVINRVKYQVSTSSTPPSIKLGTTTTDGALVVGQIVGSENVDMLTVDWNGDITSTGIITTTGDIEIVGKGHLDVSDGKMYCAEAYVDGYSIKDFVINQGTSGIWTYRIWKSKTMEMWGTYTANIAITSSSASYGGYRSGQLNIPAFPRQFSDTPTITATANSAGGFWVNNVVPTQSGGTFYLSCGSSLASASRSISFHVIGTWDQMS